MSQGHLLSCLWTAKNKKSVAAFRGRIPRKYVGYTSDFYPGVPDTLLCKGGSPRGINFYRERRILGTRFLFFYVLIYHLFVFRAIRGQFHFCLLPFKRAIYFPGKAPVLQHFHRKEFLLLTSTETFLSKPLMHF